MRMRLSKLGLGWAGTLALWVATAPGARAQAHGAAASQGTVSASAPLAEDVVGKPSEGTLVDQVVA